MALTITNWRWYSNASSEAGMVPLAAEKTPLTLSTIAEMQDGIVRLRLQVYNDDAVSSVGGNMYMCYSGDDATFLDWGDGAIPHAENERHMQWYKTNPAVSNNVAITELKLTGSTQLGKFYKQEGSALTSLTPLAKQEIDVSLRIHLPPPDQTYLMRMKTGVSNPTIAPAAGVTSATLISGPMSTRPYGAIKTLDTSAGEPREVRWAFWERIFYIDNEYYFFTVDPSDNDALLGWWRNSSTGVWTRLTGDGVNFGSTTAMNEGRMTVYYKVINSEHVLWFGANLNGTGSRVRRATLNTSTHTLTWSAGVAIGDTVRRFGQIVLDSNNIVWYISQDNASNQITARRTTTADTGVSIPTTWTGAILTDTGAGTDSHALAVQDIGGGELLVLYRKTGAFQAVVVSTAGFGTPTTLATTFNPEDWNFVRIGDLVYVVFSNSATTAGTRKLKVFRISTKTWYDGPDGATLSAATTSDGQAMVVHGSDIYVFSTYGESGSSTDRLIRYQIYTPSGTNGEAGTWSSVTDLPSTPTNGYRTNGDHLTASKLSHNNEILILWQTNDDGIINTAHTIEQHVLTLSGGDTPETFYESGVANVVVTRLVLRRGVLSKSTAVLIGADDLKQLNKRNAILVAVSNPVVKRIGKIGSVLTGVSINTIRRGIVSKAINVLVGINHSRRVITRRVIPVSIITSITKAVSKYSPVSILSSISANRRLNQSATIPTSVDIDHAQRIGSIGRVLVGASTAATRNLSITAQKLVGTFISVKKHVSVMRNVFIESYSEGFSRRAYLVAGAAMVRASIVSQRGLQKILSILVSPAISTRRNVAKHVAKSIGVVAAVRKSVRMSRVVRVAVGIVGNGAILGQELFRRFVRNVKTVVFGNKHAGDISFTNKDSSDISFRD